MLMYNIWHIKHLKKYFNDERNLYVNKFDFEISKIEIIKMTRTVKKVVSYLQKPIRKFLKIWKS